MINVGLRRRKGVGSLILIDSASAAARGALEEIRGQALHFTCKLQGLTLSVSALGKMSSCATDTSSSHWKARIRTLVSQLCSDMPQSIVENWSTGMWIWFCAFLSGRNGVGLMFCLHAS